MIVRFLLTVIVCFWMTSAVADDSPMVRVAVKVAADELILSIPSHYVVTDKDNRTIGEGNRLMPSKVFVRDDRIYVGKKSYRRDHIVFTSYQDGSIVLNDRRFRDRMAILARDGKVTAVNIVEIEKYIKGVLYHEISHRWPLEAIKAQAVATRTYAFYAMSISKSKDYDVTNDIYSQVYGGKNSERYRTGLGVDHTKGLVLTYEGKILPAFFHATCGGKTENAAELWKINIPPLRGRECGQCVLSPHYRWKRNLRLKNIQDELNAKGYHFGLIKDLVVLQRNPSGRIKTIEIVTRDGQRELISGKDFRDIVGPNLLRSNDYEIIMKGYFADFVGKGWGHGVGLCQWGAMFLSKEGKSFRQILQFYYPQTELVDYKKVVK